MAKSTPLIDASERKLDKAAKQFLAQMAAPSHPPLSPRGWASLREHLRVTTLYPGQHVVAREHWEGEGENRLLVRCEILFHSKSLRKTQRFLQQLPADVQREVTWTFC
jgi:hypothetical protein